MRRMQTFALLTVLTVFTVPAPSSASGPELPGAMYVSSLPEPEQPTMLGTVLQGLAGLAGLAVTTLLSVATLAIRSRTKDARFGALINQIWVIVQSVVAHAEKELRPKVQAALADGKLSPEEAAMLKGEVLKVLREAAGTQLTELVKGFRLPEGVLNTLLSGFVERAVDLLKVNASPVTPLSPSPAAAPTPPIAPSPH